MSSQTRKLSPRRNTTHATDVPQLVAEQLEHFGIDARSAFGKTLSQLVERLWQVALESIASLDRADRMISLGQSNTIVSCPALTTHSELSPEQLEQAGITPTTIRFAVGDEDPKDLIAHLIHTARFTIDPYVPGFSPAFMSAAAVDALVKECYLDAHRRYIEAKPSLRKLWLR
ncbi:MAG: PLP-dependent transferase [Abditibacteriales bacterium]|nr:PLP-dependent transferase [Abditibacteriales bacterium]